ncbi:MAG: rRNA maturation RNase YbeY [Chloroflexi bacterium]|nr:rRNA maturation RNase YbeY [Chloroflexota bacterium]MBU1662136.1 rRNA maturation RNase YbeY [Chloroflexota bacterium]
MITLEIAEGFRSLIDSRPVECAVEAALQHQSATQNADLTIVITGDEQIHDLNRQFRGVDAPTDVLSFPAGHTDPESGSLYLGDVLISYPRASAQAERGEHSVADEIQLLVVHGTLHLLGHDHASPDEKTKMWAAQAEILRELGIEDLGVANGE